jgi:surfactin family lipopeptide synthetase A
MPDTPELSEAKRALLEKYLQGDRPQSKTGEGTIPRRHLEKAVPLSFGQQQMWLLAQLIPDTPVYNECVTIHLPGPLDVDVFARSFNGIIRRHEAWRTSFPIIDGQPVQMIHPAPTLRLPVVDLRHLPHAEREAEALRIAKAVALPPFDLAKGPLLRPTLIQLDDEEQRLFLTMHHIIFDGFSLYQVFLPELQALYRAFLSGEPSPLPELQIQYADFASWRRGQLSGEMLAEQLAYWKKQLAGAPASLPLPTDRPRSSIPSYRGSMETFALSKRLTDALKALGLREGATLYMTLVAAFQTMLYRYTRQDDLLMGTSISDRPHPELQKLMGYFLNTLVLRTNLSGHPSFRELLRRVREVTLEALAHQDVPFEHLVRELKPERISGQNPLFQVMLSLEPPLSILPSGWTLTQMDVKTDTAKFDLGIELDDRPEGLIGRFGYNTDLFDRSTIVRMAGHWQTLLEGIVANPTLPITELPFLTDAEHHQLLAEWNATAAAYVKDQCIHQLFEVQAERTPDTIAIISDQQQLTYRQLNAKANRLAHYLRGLGVGPEVLVGIYMERSQEMMVALLGILKAGGAYVPLDPDFPRERLALMLSDARVSILVTQQSLVARLPEDECRVICIDIDWHSIEEESGANPTSGVQSANLAYVLYTSGSTGKPKGVAIEHSQLLNYTHAILERLDLAEAFSFAMVQPLTVDSCITTIFPTLCTGGCLHLISRERAIDAHAMAHYFSHHPIDCLKIAPSHLAALHASAQPGQIMPLQRLVIGGEASSWEWANGLQALAPNCTIFNHYGPTETTVGVLTYRLQPGQDERSYSTTPIGRPIANTQVYVLDEQRRPVPIGVPGELYIGGANVARGYLNRPELTAEKFIPDPFRTEPDARLYKTGDIARYLPDGNVEFLGRIDDQVKIRGFRIEPGEIEEVLIHHAAVRQVMVMAREDKPDDKQLTAYVVLHEAQNTTVSDLHDYATKHLPGYMVPAAFMLIDALPMTPHGKVDRHALPKPEFVHTTLENSFTAPHSMIHHQLVGIWEELLAVHPIGITDNFFDLGGHSLLATRMFSRIEQVCGKKLPLATFFAEATIEHLANTLLQQEGTTSRAPLVAVQASGSKRPFFFLHGDRTGGAFYCLKLARYLGPDQPFYLLEPYKFDDLQSLPTFEEMATAHIDSMRAIQPEGPYLLGGFCSGSVIAYEMARQLLAQGQTVGLLVLIDADPPITHKWVRRVISAMGSVMRWSLEQQLEWFIWYRYLRALFYYWHTGNLRRLGVHERPDELVRASNTQKWRGVHNWIASHYPAHPYAGKVTFFWNREEPFRLRRAAWRKVAEEAKEVEVHIIPGDHVTSRTEHLEVFAENLQICLNKAQEDVLIR